ncbi:MAG TPA: trypsin-like peptidase domain-containing protein, partial [Planctomycetota bacterium]|nr:trypsin-like peptidase domain-containing protein [Planctomycetota bacterium]
AEADLADVFERVAGAVVTVRTVARVTSTLAESGQVAAEGVGSGVLVDGEGHVLTAAHVVHNADAVVVELVGGQLLRAEVVASDRYADVASIRITDALPEGFAHAELGDSDAVRVGEPCFVVGAPLGITHTLTVGHVSAKRRGLASPRAMQPVELIQTDAAINQGNSGGPLFDLDGRVIGVVSHIVSRSGGSEGLGFAVSANVAKELVLSGGGVWSGLDELLVEGDLARALNLPEGRRGSLVQSIARGSLAERLGLRGGTLVAEIDGTVLLLGGDVILEAAGVDLSRSNALTHVRDALRALAPGDRIEVVILRDGATLTLSTEL